MIDIVGLGPGDLARVPGPTLELLLDAGRTVIVRTREHPAALQLAERRDVTFCDDLYEQASTFDATYEAIADRVVEASSAGPVVYAVPGSPSVGELAVPKILARFPATVHAAESFLDLVFRTVAVDPLADGFQLLNGHDLPAVLSFSTPTVIGHVDDPAVLADISALIDRTAHDGLEITVLSGLGAADEEIWTGPPAIAPSRLAGYRTSIFVPAHANGLVGVVDMMRQLRDECPWDRKQTHESLVRYLVEETYELIEALNYLTEGDEEDLGAYAEVEEELGDVLLQVLFHSVIAEDEGAFGIADVAHTLRTKMVRRHPHVFGDVEAADAETVKRNWDDIKAAEKGAAPTSLLDGVAPMPGLSRSMELGRRAAKVGFDWPEVAGVRGAITDELAELGRATGEAERRHELGDVLFSIVNLARHLDIDPEAAIQASASRFERRFRHMEREADLTNLDLEAMNELWHQAKAAVDGD
jgi:tetrapyrrole methylase family protein/MazG family protein